MVETSDFQKAIDLINQSKRVLVTTHIRPDGDACGSMRALCDVVRAMDKHVQPLLLSPLAQWYSFVFGEEQVPILGNEISVEQLDSDYDLVVIIDTNSNVQLPVFETWLKEHRHLCKVLVIDHHVTSDNLGDVELIDPSAAAAGEIVFDLIRHAGWLITKPVAEALFVAYATDSGWFRFGNADARLFRTAADLIDAGVVPAEIYRKLFQNFSIARMKLMVRMLESLELHLEGRVAIQSLRRKDFDKTGAVGTDTENLIDECQRIGSVDMAVLLVELGENKKRGRKGFRCSLRSKGSVDVRAIAQKYGGGGHTVAAGVNIDGSLEEVKKLILTEAAAQLYSDGDKHE